MGSKSQSTTETKEIFSEEDVIKIYNLCKECTPSNPDWFYRFIWVDQKIGSKENIRYQVCFKLLGYTGFQAFDKIEKFKEFLSSDSVKDNVLLIVGGPAIPDTIKVALQQNKLKKKV